MLPARAKYDGDDFSGSRRPVDDEHDCSANFLNWDMEMADLRVGGSGSACGVWMKIWNFSWRVAVRWSEWTLEFHRLPDLLMVYWSVGSIFRKIEICDGKPFEWDF